MTTRYKKIKLNAHLMGHRKGDVIAIEVDEEGTPTTKFWRDRFKDAAIDNCISAIEESEKLNNKSKSKEG